MNNAMSFEQWKQEVSKLMSKDDWTDESIATVDWVAWKECYFDSGDTPEQATPLMFGEDEGAKGTK